MGDRLAVLVLGLVVAAWVLGLPALAVGRL